ncbi:MAG: hypothetical protein L0H73_05390 [Nitrococcus sp.]|nr:hypothetical protein [Nitrococcus sp.]
MGLTAMIRHRAITVELQTQNAVMNIGCMLIAAAGLAFVGCTDASRERAQVDAAIPESITQALKLIQVKPIKIDCQLIDGKG